MRKLQIYSVINNPLKEVKMKTLFFIPLVLMTLVSSPSWGETFDDLAKREGIYYKKFTEVPFTGKVTGNDPFYSEGRNDVFIYCFC